MVDIGKVLSKLTNKTDKIIDYVTIFKTDYAFTSGQYRKIAFNIPQKDGYTALLINCSCYNNSSIRVFNWSFTGNGGSYEVEAVYSGTTTVNADFAFRILYIRDLIM